MQGGPWRRVGWAPEAVWKIWRKTKRHISAGNRNTACRFYSPQLFFFLCNLRKENEYISFWDDKNKEKCIVVSMRHLRRDTGIEMKVWLLYCFNTRCVWKLLISITFFYTIPRKHMNWLWTYVGLRTSGFEGNNPAPVWYRTPVLNIISTYLKELTVSTSIRKERMYVKFVRRPIRGTE